MIETLVVTVRDATVRVQLYGTVTQERLHKETVEAKHRAEQLATVIQRKREWDGPSIHDEDYEDA